MQKIHKRSSLSVTVSPEATPSESFITHHPLSTVLPTQRCLGDRSLTFSLFSPLRQSVNQVSCPQTNPWRAGTDNLAPITSTSQPPPQFPRQDALESLWHSFWERYLIIRVSHLPVSLASIYIFPSLSLFLSLLFRTISIRSLECVTLKDWAKDCQSLIQ